MKQLCMDVMSIGPRQGLYVLADRRLEIDAGNRVLRPVPEITICKEFSVEGGEAEHSAVSGRGRPVAVGEV